MNYLEQLASKPWKSKREQIIARDNFKCQKCGLHRNDLLSISFNSEIKTHNDVLNEGYRIKIHDNSRSVALVKNKKTKIYELITKGNFIPEQLEFAKKWQKSQSGFGIGRYRFICYDTNIDKNLLSDLNVHHRYYISGKLAWEYPNSALITLCTNCHGEIHKSNTIPYYDENLSVVKNKQQCLKCSGIGYLEAFKHFMGGVCFNCMGTGLII